MSMSLRLKGLPEPELNTFRYYLTDQLAFSGIDTPVYEDRVAFFLEFFNPSTTSLTRAEDF